MAESRSNARRLLLLVGLLVAATALLATQTLLREAGASGESLANTPTASYCPAGGTPKGGEGVYEQWCEKGGVRSGPYRQWSLDGRLALDGEYADGKRTGTWTSWQPNGVRLVGASDDSGAVGSWKAYYPTGGLLGTITYLHNRPEGPFIALSSAERKLADGVCHDGEARPGWNAWDDAGRPTHVEAVRKAVSDVCGLRIQAPGAWRCPDAPKLMSEWMVYLKNNECVEKSYVCKHLLLRELVYRGSNVDVWPLDGQRPSSPIVLGAMLLDFVNSVRKQVGCTLDDAN